MLLGQSIFQSVLNRLEDEKQETEEATANAADFRVRGLGAGFLTPEGRPAPTNTDTGAYLDHLEEWLEQKPETRPEEMRQEQDEPPVMPPHLARLSEEAIANDLGLSPADTETTLNEKRRQFAKLNHPDRVLPDFRENATARMKIANLMIDRAIADLG